eukprot:1146468-Pelagomonas_calceolata.AAC.10
MAREVDPEGKRTIGVVTKPDCIEPGCHTAWVDVVTGRRERERERERKGELKLWKPSGCILGRIQSGECASNRKIASNKKYFGKERHARLMGGPVCTKLQTCVANQYLCQRVACLPGPACRWPLRLGYYILKNPAQSQLGMEFAAARAAESHYFATTHPWSGLAAGYSSRFGAAALRSSLSKLMAHLIGRSLPGLTASAQQQLRWEPIPTCLSVPLWCSACDP